MAIHTSLGTPTADSYVSVASANAYFIARENADTWLNISTEESTTTLATTRKQSLLKQATRELDNSFRFFDDKYNLGIKGSSDYQALEFPRGSNTDADGDLYIPDEIKYATYEQAIWIPQRTGKRTTEDGAVIEKQFISSEAYNYIKGWVNKQINLYGQYTWQGNKY